MQYWFQNGGCLLVRNLFSTNTWFHLHLSQGIGDWLAGEKGTQIHFETFNKSAFVNYFKTPVLICCEFHPLKAQEEMWGSRSVHVPFFFRVNLCLPFYFEIILFPIPHVLASLVPQFCVSYSCFDFFRSTPIEFVCPLNCTFATLDL